MRSLGIMSIATNKYLDYWKDQAESVNRTLARDLAVTLHVFTDRTEDALVFARGLGNLKVEVYSIPPLGWPEATLHRYKIFHEHRHSLKDDWLMYLDADMLVHESFASVILAASDGVTLVRHPGYFRASFPSNLRLYAKTPQLLLPDLYQRLMVGGIGAWETRKISRAYVKREDRKHYFCGGIWWGANGQIVELLNNLRVQVEEDESNSIMAVWHDESHLNKWAAENRKQSLDPRYCYSIGYVWLEGVPNLVQAVDKHEVTR